MNSPPAEADIPDEIKILTKGSVKMKRNLVSSNEEAFIASWGRILGQIREEARVITQTGPKIIPSIDFKELCANTNIDSFLRKLKSRGAAIIHNVIPRDEAADWVHELDSYLRDNPHTKVSSPETPEIYELFWSLAQLNARAHPNMLAAQKIIMKGCWHHSSAPQERLSTNFPVTYAERLQMTHKGLGEEPDPKVIKAALTVPAGVLIDGCSGERWEADGNGVHSAAARYRSIWSGDWEDYDPWESSARLEGMTDSHNDQSASSVFKMFQGILPLSLGSSDDNLPMRLCPLPPKLTTAYRVLRQFFSPKRPLMGSKEASLDPSNWVLDPMMHGSTAHTAQPSRLQAINDTLDPHLHLEQTLISLPPLKPGDYVIWHPDTIYALPSARPSSDTPSPSSPKTSHTPAAQRSSSPPLSILLYIPACPLTPNNAEYLARQRRAFLLGFPAPDFATTRREDRRAETGDESCHLGRPGVQEIYDAGGEEALRAMGLLAWEEDEAVDESERGLLMLANAVLFPDRVEGG